MRGGKERVWAGARAGGWRVEAQQVGLPPGGSCHLAEVMRGGVGQGQGPALVRGWSVEEDLGVGGL